MTNIIFKHLKSSLDLLIKIQKKTKEIEEISYLIEKKIKLNKKIFVYGNGGSFADSSHFVGELTATYNKKNRRPLPFYLLGSNMAAITAWSNDFNFDDYIARELSCYAASGDIVILFSTSGGNIKEKQSLNLIKIAKMAKKKKINIICLLGKDGGVLKKIADKLIIINSQNIGNIQEMHKIIFHSICAYLDQKF